MIVQILREWCRLQTAAEESLEQRQRGIMIALSLAVAISRLFALSRSLWDWDEVLFSLSLHNFDVAAHHPHPPGFPLYVLLGRLVRLVVGDDFRALRGINCAAAMLLFPAIYRLARAFRFDFATSIAAALVFVFLPNVWFLGGTAFSDVPSLCVLLFAVGCLLRGRTDGRLYLVGSLLLGIALSFRPQNGLIAAYPWIVATWSRFRERKSDVLAGAIMTTVIVVGAFGGAAAATGVKKYRTAVREHGAYVVTVDGYRNPHRPPSLKLVKPFLLDPFGGLLLYGLTLVGAVGLLRGRKSSLEVLATFGPAFVMCCFVLNPESISRYSITYLPATALLAAEGMGAIGMLVAAVMRWLRGARSTNLRHWISGTQGVLATAFAGSCMVWTAPSLAEVRKHDAPTVAVMRWIRRNVNPARSPIYVHGSLGPWAEYYLHEYRQVPVGDDLAINAIDARGGWFVTEGLSTSSASHQFSRSRGRLYGIARQRYFDASVRPLSDVPRFAEGWYEQEGSGSSVWRWMGKSSATFLPAMSGRGVLSLRFYIPLDALRRPQVTVTFNGTVVDRIACDKAEMQRSYVLSSHQGTENALRIEMDQVVNPARENLAPDGRDLGLQLREISWKPE